MRKYALIMGVMVTATVVVQASVMLHEEFDGNLYGYNPDGTTAQVGDSDWVDFSNRFASDGLGTASTGESVIQATATGGTGQFRSDFDVGLNAAQITNITLRIRQDVDGNGIYDDALDAGDMKFFWSTGQFIEPGAGNNVAVNELIESSVTLDGGNGWYVYTYQLAANELSGDFKAIRMDPDGATVAGRILELDYLKIEAIPEPTTLGLVGILGGALVWVRQRRMR